MGPNRKVFDVKNPPFHMPRKMLNIEGRNIIGCSICQDGGTCWVCAKRCCLCGC